MKYFIYTKHNKTIFGAFVLSIIIFIGFISAKMKDTSFSYPCPEEVIISQEIRPATEIISVDSALTLNNKAVKVRGILRIDEWGEVPSEKGYQMVLENPLKKTSIKINVSENRELFLKVIKQKKGMEVIIDGRVKQTLNTQLPILSVSHYSQIQEIV